MDTIAKTFNIGATIAWIDAKAVPPKPGFILKRWKNGALWAGFFDGSSKLAGCDQWYPLNLAKI